MNSEGEKMSEQSKESPADSRSKRGNERERPAIQRLPHAAKKEQPLNREQIIRLITLFKES